MKKASKGKKQRTLTLAELSRLGYKPGGFIPIGAHEHMSTIFEMKDADNNKQAGFSYLQVLNEVDGVVLPNSFDYYRAQENYNLSEYQQRK